MLASEPTASESNDDVTHRQQGPTRLLPWQPPYIPRSDHPYLCAVVRVITLRPK